MTKLAALSIQAIDNPALASRRADAAVGVAPLRLERFLLGRTTAVGIFEDRFGAVRRRMSIVLNGWMEQGALHLDEDFTYDDGKRERRLWRIKPIGEYSYQATTEGLHGMAIGGQTKNGVTWAYDFDLEIGPRVWRVRFDESFTLIAPQVMLNRAKISKFGVAVGRTSILFTRDGA